MTTPNERAGIIDKMEVPEGKGLSAQRKSELREIAKQIAADPNFIGKELARTAELENYVDKETGKIGGNVVGSLELNPGTATQKYSEFVRGALSAKGIDDYKMVDQKIGKQTIQVEGDNPEAAYVYALLSESHEKVRSGQNIANAKMDIPSGYHPGLMMTAQEQSGSKGVVGR